MPGRTDIAPGAVVMEWSLPVYIMHYEIYLV